MSEVTAVGVVLATAIFALAAAFTVLARVLYRLFGVAAMMAVTIKHIGDKVDVAELAKAMAEAAEIKRRAAPPAKVDGQWRS